jgi:hypothetical protein
VTLSRPSRASSKQTARQIVQLREETRRRAQAGRMSATTLRLIDYLFERPFINVNAARDYLGVPSRRRTA